MGNHGGGGMTEWRHAYIGVSICVTATLSPAFCLVRQSWSFAHVCAKVVCPLAALQVDTIITIFQGRKPRSEEIKKILHDLVVKLKLEFNESFLKLKFGRNRKKNIVVTKQWDDFLIWLQELALQIILNQQIWKCFQRRQQHHNKTKVPKETSVMGTNASLSCLYIIFVWSQRIS